MQYTYLYERAVHYFLDTYSEFVPVEGSGVFKESQEEAYKWVRKLYEKANETPDFFGKKTLPDDSYDDWQMNKEKPGLDVNIRKLSYKLASVVNAAYEACLYGEWSDEEQALIVRKEKLSSETEFKKLSKLGVDVVKNEATYSIIIDKATFDGLQKMAQTSLDFYNKAEYKTYHPYCFQEVCLILILDLINQYFAA